MWEAPRKNGRESRQGMTTPTRKIETVRPQLPGMDPSAPYASRLSARSALYADLCLLLDAADGLLSSEAFRQTVIDDNCLARSSESARRKMWKELKSRYVLDASNPLISAFWQEWQRCGPEQERG